MEGVDWVETLVGLSAMIAFVIVAWSTQMLIDTMRKSAESEDEGPGTLGS